MPYDGLNMYGNFTGFTQYMGTLQYNYYYNNFGHLLGIYNMANGVIYF